MEFLFLFFVRTTYFQIITQRFIIKYKCLVNCLGLLLTSSYILIDPYFLSRLYDVVVPFFIVTRSPTALAGNSHNSALLLPRIPFAPPNPAKLLAIQLFIKQIRGQRHIFTVHKRLFHNTIPLTKALERALVEAVMKKRRGIRESVRLVRLQQLMKRQQPAVLFFQNLLY